MTKLIVNNKQELLFNNLLLIFPVMTFIFFNYLKIYHFEGYIIDFFAFFHIFIILSYVYYINFNKLNNKSSNKTVLNASKFAIILLFLINIFIIINPYKNQMTFVKSNILFTLLLFIIFNIMNIFNNLLLQINK